MLKQKKGLAFVRDKFMSLENACVPITDLGFQRSYGVTEVLKTYSAKIFALDEHLLRLSESAELVGIQPPSKKKLKQYIEAGIKKINLDEVLVKIIVTGGDGDYLEPHGTAALYILFTPHHGFPKSYYTKGIAVSTFTFTRQYPKGKFMDYSTGVFAHMCAKKDGFHAALYINSDRHILEGTTFNFGIIKDDVLITPKKEVLDGITMRFMVDAAKRVGLRVQKRVLEYPELRSADEAFITSTNREAVPVIRVDSITIGNGKPGKWVKDMREEFERYARTHSN